LRIKKKSDEKLLNISSEFAAIQKVRVGDYKSSAEIVKNIQFDNFEYNNRQKYNLYRFLSKNIPAVSAALATWVRLSAAPGKLVIDCSDSSENIKSAQSKLDRLVNNLFMLPTGNRVGISLFLSDLFRSLYRDGIYAGFLTVDPDGAGVDRFISIDVNNIIRDETGRLFIELDNRKISLDRPDFYCLSLNADLNHPLGCSILQPIPFVTYIEQQLVEDMRRSNHNSGYHRLHVKITPPERLSGESDKIYIDRINSYFDSTVSMIKSCDVDENPVTWDNVNIDSVGPTNVRTVTNSWFLNHRAMIEEICAGTNLAPFLLGYSFGATSTWSSFKFDIVMRQVRSIQEEAKNFLEWIGNIDLAMNGFNYNCRFEFDNNFSYQAIDEKQIKSSGIENILKLYQAGLIDEETAKYKAGELI
jgi:hypothetical protein